MPLSPETRARSICIVNSVSVWSSYPENQIWRSYRSKSASSHLGIQATIVFILDYVSVWSRSEAPIQKNSTIIQATSGCTLDSVSVWYRSEAPIQNIESEGHESKSESSRPPGNPSKIHFRVGFCIGLISVWKLLSRKPNLKNTHASLRNPGNINVCFGFCIGLISVWKLLSRKPNPKDIQTILRAPSEESEQHKCDCVSVSVWYRSDAPIQRIESEGYTNKSEGYRPGVQATPIVTLDSVSVLISVWSSYPENRIWKS